jgi:predicted nucleic acid-binding Zn ribbon protein
MKLKAMLKIFDYRCSTCNEVTEHIVEDSAAELLCECGTIKNKMLSSPAFILDGASGDFPGRHMRWIKEHEAAGKNGNPDG